MRIGLKRYYILSCYVWIGAKLLKLKEIKKNKKTIKDHFTLADKEIIRR